MSTENQNKEPEKGAGKKKNRNSIAYIFGGRMFTEDFIIKQSGLILTIFILILIFISNRYYCAKQLTEMDRLKRELTELKGEQVDLLNELTPIKDQLHIEALLKEKGIELKKANTKTVYKIKK